LFIFWLFYIIFIYLSKYVSCIKRNIYIGMLIILLLLKLLRRILIKMEYEKFYGNIRKSGTSFVVTVPESIIKHTQLDETKPVEVLIKNIE